MLSSAIIDFYLTRAPYAHSDKPVSKCSIDLADFGWAGTTPLHRLMQFIVFHHKDNHGAPNLRFTAGADAMDAIGKTLAGSQDLGIISLRSMELGGVFCIKRKLTMKGDYSCTCELIEAYGTCFFRHIRNSIAHGNYREEDDLVLFLDQGSSMGTKDPKYTCAFMTSVSFLEDLSQLVLGGYEAFAADETLLGSLKGVSYRVPKNLSLSVDDKGPKD